MSNPAETVSSGAPPTEEMNQVTLLDEEGKPLTKNALKKLEKQREKEKKKAEVAARLAAEKAARDAGTPVKFFVE